MIKYLSREKSKEILDLGIHPDFASLVSWKSIKNWQGNLISGKEKISTKPFRPAVMGFEDFDCQDIFTIGDLIEILPQYINEDQSSYNLCIEPYMGGGWIVSYDNFYDNTLHVCRDNEMIFALYKMVIWFLTRK